ncbi:MAG TPA: DnaJ family domain-containing protein [Burkholderiaceae bacterium]|nr:DnaJ family domain-containing protein [Burkholderiaceae bacterium]
MRSLDEEIARRLAEAAESGELAKAESYGKPLAETEGWSDTPEALRLPFKILKDAGVVPREVEMFRERAALARALEACSDPVERDQLARKLSELEQAIALRLEALRINPSL